MGNHDIIKLEGWTCSNAGWLPTIIISGPIRKAIGINSGRNFLSAYTRPQACIARAMAYMIMNISGVRMQQEDMSGPGSDSRFGLCIAEDEENLPEQWETLPAEAGRGGRRECGHAVLAQRASSTSSVQYQCLPGSAVLVVAWRLRCGLYGHAASRECKAVCRCGLVETGYSELRQGV